MSRKHHWKPSYNSQKGFLTLDSLLCSLRMTPKVQNTVIQMRSYQTLTGFFKMTKIPCCGTILRAMGMSAYSCPSSIASSTWLRCCGVMWNTMSHIWCPLIINYSLFKGHQAASDENLPQQKGLFPNVLICVTLWQPADSSIKHGDTWMLISTSYPLALLTNTVWQA